VSLTDLGQVFVSLLVAIDVVGLLPIYLGLTADLSPGERRPLARVGVMPLGVPMIAGPAVLTSLLTLGRTHGRLVTLAGFALNLLVVWVALRWAAALNGCWARPARRPWPRSRTSCWRRSA
jgi:small neutral amino acid transporter SnatA (MarC family)